ncbi:MAG: CsgG/HfaB family protein [Selenomonadaceae bacterium]|nr:CsgG/HfaB family protein [Selenomonadaceae bacterium]
MCNILVNFKRKAIKRLRYFVAVAAIAVLCSSTILSVAQAADIHGYPTVAVMQFGNKAITSQGLRAYDFDSASEYAIYQLLASGWFDLVDYEQLGNIAKMHEVNMSGMVDQSTAVQLGKFAGAQFMVVGNVTGLTTKQSGIDYQHGKKGGAGVAIRTVIANVAIRIVDIETGKIVGAGLGKGESTSSSVEIVFKKYRKPKNIVNADIDPYLIGSTTNNSDINTDSDVSEDSGLSEIGNDTEDNSQNDYESMESAEGISEDESLSTGDNGFDENNTDNGTYNVSMDIGGTLIDNNLLTQLADNSSMAHLVDDENGSDSEVYYSDTNGYTDDVGTESSSTEEEVENYSIKIGSQSFSAVQVRNAISKAVRDAIYGDMGLMTMLNDGKKLKVKTGF